MQIFDPAIIDTLALVKGPKGLIQFGRGSQLRPRDFCQGVERDVIKGKAEIVSDHEQKGICYES